MRALPGIGDYTAGAICSICFESPTAAVDGNVLRIAARIAEKDEPIDLPAVKKSVRTEFAGSLPCGTLRRVHAKPDGARRSAVCIAEGNEM